MSNFPIRKTEDEWRALLAEKGAEPGAYEVTRHAWTERPFTGKYEQVWADGSYHCICCGNHLFDAGTKFDAGCGWPSFWTAAEPDNVDTAADHSHYMIRTEVLCHQCGAHLGHVFEDGPQPTGLRYCINSASIKLEKDQE